MPEEKPVGRRGGLPGVLGQELPAIARAQGDIVNIHPNADVLAQLRGGVARGVNQALPERARHTGHGKREQHRRLRAALCDALSGREEARVMGKGAGQQRMLFVTEPPCHRLMIGLRRGRRSGQRRGAADRPEGVARVKLHEDAVRMLVGILHDLVDQASHAAGRVHT
eukprot:1617387-Amphidinium_carterae.1